MMSLTSKQAKKLDKTLRSIEQLLKVFCPTGEGGGVDASCSPDQGGSSGDSNKQNLSIQQFKQEAVDIIKDIIKNPVEFRVRQPDGSITTEILQDTEKLGDSISDLLTSMTDTEIERLGISDIDVVDRINDIVSDARPDIYLEQDERLMDEDGGAEPKKYLRAILRFVDKLPDLIIDAQEEIEKESE